jgi:hypothetical protein
MGKGLSAELVAKLSQTAIVVIICSTLLIFLFVILKAIGKGYTIYFWPPRLERPIAGLKATTDVMRDTAEVLPSKSTDKPETNDHHKQVASSPPTSTVEKASSGGRTRAGMITANMPAMVASRVARAADEGFRRESPSSPPELAHAQAPLIGPAVVFLQPIGSQNSEIIVVSADARYVMFGSADDCDIFLSGNYVSRHHLRMIIKAVDPADTSSGYRVSVIDTGSANGTLINKKKISSETVLKDGDVIAIGDRVFLFKHLMPPRKRDNAKLTTG